MNYRFLVSIPLIVAVVFPTVAFADEIYSGCDIADDLGGPAGGYDVFCAASDNPFAPLPTDLDFYGIQINVVTPPTAPALYMAVEQTASSDGCYSVPVVPTGTGAQNFMLDTPLSFSTGDTPIVRLRDDPSCASAVDGLTAYTNDALGGFATAIWLWEPNVSADPCLSGKSRLCHLTPLYGATFPSGEPVAFSLLAWIAPEDIAGQFKIRLTLHNIDQNVLLLGDLSPSDIYIIGNRVTGGVLATTSGLFTHEASRYIGDGNYRINAVMEADALFGFIKNPFRVQENISHQFVVGSGTFIGNISQNLWGDLQQDAATKSATSTAALLGGCNVLGNFDISNCMYGLFVPDAYQVNQLVMNFKTGVAAHAPWGYVNRLYDIITSSTTEELPGFTASIPTGPGSDEFEYTTVTINPAEMLTTGAALLDDIRDPVDNKSARDVFYPMVQLSVALMVIFTIASDIMGSHRHHTEEGRGKKA